MVLVCDSDLSVTSKSIKLIGSHQFYGFGVDSLLLFVLVVLLVQSLLQDVCDKVIIAAW